MIEKDWKAIQNDVRPKKVVWVCQCSNPDCELEIELFPGERGEIISRNLVDSGDSIYLIRPDCERGLNEIKIGLYQEGERDPRFIVQKGIEK